MSHQQDSTAVQVVAGRSVGPFTLGASLHETLSQIKSQPSVYPSLEIFYSHERPLHEPVTINLPRNGIRIRFDGIEQHLRLIEIIDFSRMKFMYNGLEIARSLEGSSSSPMGPRTNRGPTFRHVYDKLVGPTYKGEYFPPANVQDKNASGAYVLSWPGLAFSFPLKHTVYDPDKDYLPLLSSSAASPATALSVYTGEEWKQARPTLFTTAPVHPKSNDHLEDVEIAKIHGSGIIELERRSGTTLQIVLGETTPQDLITELGPPDAIHWKKDHQMSIHKERTSSQASNRSLNALRSKHRHRSQDDGHDASALQTDDDDDDDDDDDWEDDDFDAVDQEPPASEHFYNYFSQGFDILISETYKLSPPSPTASPNETREYATDEEVPRSSVLAASKVIFHGNIPGSYQFNRHRRCRWTLEHILSKHYDSPPDSEMTFGDLSSRLKDVFSSTYTDAKEQANMERGMAVNRGWGDSPGSSMELLGGLEEHSISLKKPATGQSDVGPLEGPAPGIGRTTLYGFPGMIFEVLDNDAICTLTVY